MAGDSDDRVDDAVHIAKLEADLEAARYEIANLRLQLDVLATTDVATGLPNIHGLVEIIGAAADRMERSGEEFGMIALEVPGLDALYVKEGPDAYRSALRHIGAMIAATLRRIDRVGRAGPNTFVAVLTDLEHGGVERVIARLEHVVSSEPLGLGATPHPRIAVVLSPDRPPVDPADMLGLALDAVSKASPGDPAVTTAAATPNSGALPNADIGQRD